MVLFTFSAVLRQLQFGVSQLKTSLACSGPKALPRYTFKSVVEIWSDWIACKGNFACMLWLLSTLDPLSIFSEIVWLFSTAVDKKKKKKRMIFILISETFWAGKKEIVVSSSHAALCFLQSIVIQKKISAFLPEKWLNWKIFRIKTSAENRTPSSWERYCGRKPEY